MTNSTFPQQMPGSIPGVPPIPQQQQQPMTNLIPGPQGGGIDQGPETYNWAEMLMESNVQEQPMPAADYDAQVVASEDGKASNGKLMFKLTFQIISGPYAGRRLSRNLVVSTDSKKAMQVFFRQMRALGFDDQFWMGNPPAYMVAEMMMNRMARIQVTQREWPKNTGIIDNEVGFIREQITSAVGMPSMINQAPPMPQFGQPQQYAQPQQYPPPGQQFMTSSPTQPQPMQAAPISPYAQQVPPQQAQPAQPVQQYPPQQPAPQLPPAQNIPVGAEQVQPPMPPTWAQTAQQPAAPAPQTPEFQQMLRPPQEAAAPQPPAQQPLPLPQQPPAPQQPTDGPQQPTAEEIAAFQAYMAQQGGQQQQPQPQQPPPPPLPAQF